MLVVVALKNLCADRREGKVMHNGSNSHMSTIAEDLLRLNEIRIQVRQSAQDKILGPSLTKIGNYARNCCASLLDHSTTRIRQLISRKEARSEEQKATETGGKDRAAFVR